MKTKIFATVAAALLALMAPPAARAGGSELTLKFDKGIKMESADGSFKLKLGGRIMADSAYFDADKGLETFLGTKFEDGSELRRARLYMSGQIYDVVLFKIQLDFAGSQTALKDVYVGIKGIPGIGTVKVGHFKEPFSLEELTSSKYITLMERSLADVFAPGRNTGIAIQNHTENDRLTWGLGVFMDADEKGKSVCNNHNVSGRITGLPWVGKDGDVLHVGFSASHRNPCDNMVRYKQRPEAHIAPRIVDTGSGTIADATGVDLYNLELAGVLGPFSLQAEATKADVNSNTTGDPSFDGGYVEASYFLTGEKRVYKKSHGAFDKVSPRANFGQGGLGAWQLALRYSTLDLNDGPVNGGNVDVITAGVNWYLNPNTRVMFNIGHADRDKISGGSANIAQTRFQVFF